MAGNRCSLAVINPMGPQGAPSRGPTPWRSGLPGGVRSARVLGGIAAIAASAALFIVVLVRDVGPNPANLFTIVGAALAGAAAIGTTSRSSIGRAIVAIVVFAAPALFGGLGLAYAPAVALLLLALSGSGADRGDCPGSR